METMYACLPRRVSAAGVLTLIDWHKIDMAVRTSSVS